jgi:hypothetical protein
MLQRVRPAGWMLLVILLLVLGFSSMVAAQSQVSESFRELLERSEKEKKGLTFYVKGQAIAGVVVKVIGTAAVEIRNREYSRIIIRLESIDALAIN